MKVTIVPVTPFQQNCSVLVCEETNRAAIVDPGGDIDGKILKAVEQTGATVEKILLTHAHIDHCGGTPNSRSVSGCRWRARTATTSSGSTCCRSRP